MRNISGVFMQLCLIPLWIMLPFTQFFFDPDYCLHFSLCTLLIRCTNFDSKSASNLLATVSQNFFCMINRSEMSLWFIYTALICSLVAISSPIPRMQILLAFLVPLLHAITALNSVLYLQPYCRLFPGVISLWSVLWTGVGLRWLVTLVNHS